MSEVLYTPKGRKKAKAVKRHKKMKKASKTSRRRTEATPRTAHRARQERDKPQSQLEPQVDLITPLRQLDALTLVFGEELDVELMRYSALEDYPRTIELSRVHITPDIKLPELAQTATGFFTSRIVKPSIEADVKSDDAAQGSDGSVTDLPTVVLRRWRGYSKPNDDGQRRFGLTADIFYADLHDGGKTSSGLVVKLVDLRCIRERGRLPNQTRVKEDLASEVHSFNMAESLQGSCLPRLAGLFRWESLYCLVFDYAGKPLQPRELGTIELQEEIIAALKKIHGVGIAPYYQSDAAYRVVRRGLDGQIKFCHIMDCHRLDILTPERLQELIDERHPYAGLSAEETLVKFHDSSIQVVKESFPNVYD